MKVPKPRKLSSGKYFIQLRLDGKSISVTDYDEKNCIRKAELIKAEHRNGIVTQKMSGLTLRQAIDKYIADRDKVLSPSTIRGYRIVQRNAFPSQMDKSLSELTEWQKWANNEAKRVSPKTLKNELALIRSVLKENGIDMGDVRLPQAVKPDEVFLQPEEIKPFIQAFYDDPYEVPVLIALHGLRRSEILSLTDKSFKDDIIHVRGASVVDEDGNTVSKKTNKNASSRRDVPIIIPRLSELVRGLAPGPVVTVRAETIRRHINKVCRENNLPEVGWHKLRHSFVSLAYHLGLSELETMKLGGYSDISTMRKIYTHLAKSDEMDSINKLKDFFKE